MENNTEKQTLSFNKGMTNVPSDLLSDDAELAMSEGFLYSDGEMRPIQEPEKIQDASAGGTLMYIHKRDSYKNYVFFDAAESCINTVNNVDGTDAPTNQKFEIDNVKQVTSVGNTLECLTDDGIYYALFKEGAYIWLGKELPKPTVDAYMEATPEYITCGDYFNSVESTVDLEQYCIGGKNGVAYWNNVLLATVDYVEKATDGYCTATKVYEENLCKDDETGDYIYPVEDPGLYNKGTYYMWHVKNDMEDSFKTAVQGYVASELNAIKEKREFAYPFFIRYALRLFDGSYARISNPIICWPSINSNCYLAPHPDTNFTDKATYLADWGTLKYSLQIISSKLKLSIKIDKLSNWTDIVKSVVVFATSEVRPFEMDGDWHFCYPPDYKDKNIYDGIINAFSRNTATFKNINGYFSVSSDLSHYASISVEKTQGTFCSLIEGERKSETKIIEELEDNAVFYKLFSLDVTDSKLDGNYIDTSELMEKTTLKNLTSQEQLKVDDYYGWTSKSASMLYPYNNRLNAFGLKRYPFEGFNLFAANTTTKQYSVHYLVHISNAEFSAWVKQDGAAESPDLMSSWFYYPDPNADKVIIYFTYWSWYKGVQYELKEHPRLNGAYCLRLPTGSDPTLADYGFNELDSPTNNYELLDSSIYTSVVNNPFVFESTGDNVAGTGSVIGIAANTEAISQGQFGQYPLIVFTSEGVYGMSVNSEGLISSIYPISREVCNNADSITPTDKLVFFTSDKGLMAVSGGSVTPVSTQMAGRTSRNFLSEKNVSFVRYLSTCKIAYDYKDSLLRVFNTDYDWHYIYNMKDGTWAVVDWMKPLAVCNDYPDNIVQDSDGLMYSLTGKPDINEDPTKYSGRIVTRPLKLGSSITLKSLRQIKNLIDSDEGKLKLTIYGSNDCKYWQKLPSIYGKPWKYFTFEYALTDFLATDSFAGTLVEYQNRRTDKMR